ncbi:MAG: hypothetical protein CVU21_13215 [Betaproteobacteria bacterium HGW-Betaproteobacteria-15]|nr:MAG: hypothetical protein CVU21_13215 [Betaproteobacteria bacterium HGW-Betaproteobacteria-15]
MKTILSAVAIAISTLGAGQVLAADPAAPKTRAEVKTELAEAIRSGNMIADSESGATFKQLYPHRYAQQPATTGKTRAEVKAELVEAIRSGNMIADRESGATFKQLYPGRYAPQS